MEMYRVIYVSVLGIFLLDVDKVHACFCPISHPQTDYCHLSSFALVGSVSDFVDSNYDRRFNVIVQFMLKVPEGYTHRKRLKLKTYKGPILCELNLLPGIRYLITGYVNSDDEYLVNSCMWAEDLNTLTSSEYSGLLGDYDCSCYINEAWGLIPPYATPRDVCNYDKTTSCEQAACLRGEQGTCEWLLKC